MIIRILPSALDDLADGFLFYEYQKSGLGNHFLATLESEIDKLDYEASIHPVVYDFYHVKYSDKFPYAIFYYIFEGTVMVDAVLDCRRDPDWIKERLN